MIDTAKRFAAAALMSARRMPQRARDQLYGGKFGLRIMLLHDVPPPDFDRFRRLVDQCLERFELAGPEAVEDLFHGRCNDATSDKLLITFDDGLASNYQAAAHLAKCGVRAIFFVIPSFIDRTMQQYFDFHASNGVQAFGFETRGEPKGLSRSQVHEMAAMGHLIAGHNFAHRDLGKLTAPSDLEYEIDRAVDGVAELIDGPCQQFAFGFGHPKNISPEARAHAQRRCTYLHAAVRGLNVPGRSPRLLLRQGTDLEHPFLFHRLCLQGGFDLHWAEQVERLKQLGGTIPAENAAI
jgi:hypothetical protein